MSHEERVRRPRRRGARRSSAQVSAELMQNPAVREGHAGRAEGKEQLDQAVGQALKQHERPDAQRVQARAWRGSRLLESASWPTSSAKRQRRRGAPAAAAQAAARRQAGERHGRRDAGGSRSRARARSWASRAAAPPGRAAPRGDASWRSTSRRRPPPSGVRHRERGPHASPPPTSALLDVFREEEVDTVVHLAFFTNPRRDTTLRPRAGVDRHPEPPRRGRRGGRRRTWSCARSPRSTARAARTRTSSPRTGRCSRTRRFGWVRDKLEAEQHAASLRASAIRT